MTIVGHVICLVGIVVEVMSQPFMRGWENDYVKKSP